MQDGLDGEVATLIVKGEFKNMHFAGADHHLVVPIFNPAMTPDAEKRTWSGFVLLCPESKTNKKQIMIYF